METFNTQNLGAVLGQDLLSLVPVYSRVYGMIPGTSHMIPKDVS